MRAAFLTEKERVLAVHRIRSNNTGILNRKLKWNQIKEALNPLQDPQGLLLFLTIFCNEVLKSVYSLTHLFLQRSYPLKTSLPIFLLFFNACSFDSPLLGNQLTFHIAVVLAPLELWSSKVLDLIPSSQHWSIYRKASSTWSASSLVDGWLKRSLTAESMLPLACWSLPSSDYSFKLYYLGRTSPDYWLEVSTLHRKNTCD